MIHQIKILLFKELFLICQNVISYRIERLIEVKKPFLPSKA